MNHSLPVCGTTANLGSCQPCCASGLIAFISTAVKATSHRTSTSPVRKWRPSFGCASLRSRPTTDLPKPNSSALNSSWTSIAKNCWKLIFKRMVVEPTTETVASRCWVEARRICLELADGRCVSFPAAKYPRLAHAPQNPLEQVQLRLHGLALRWEELDEDIWVEDAVCGRFPRRKELAA